MYEKNLIDSQVLGENAKKSEHKESIKELKKSKHYKINVGARCTSSKTLSFFLEVVVYFLVGFKVNISLLEKKLMLLKELETKGFYLNSDDDGCIYGEFNVEAQKLNYEYEQISLVIKNYLKDI